MSNRNQFAEIAQLTRRDVLFGAGAVGLSFAFFGGLLRAGAQTGGPGVSVSSIVSPPSAAKPWVYWWWLDGNANKEGISKDLAEMQRQGIAEYSSPMPATAVRLRRRGQRS
jgi:hypothetical protein